VGPYYKGNEFKGYVLKSADEIKAMIEDHLTNLGQIGNSRYASAFMDKVRGWEKALNIMFECIECWFLV
jgi:hypothetical protein